MLILVLAAFFFSLFSLAGKAVSDEISSVQMIVVRSAIMLPVLAFWAVRAGQPLVGDKKLLLFLRGALGSLSLFFFFVALKRLPLTDTVLIFQAHPILVAALAPWFLKEPNRLVHWVLIAVSLVGVAFVVGPTGAGNHPVVNVSWSDAEAYVQFMGLGLPTELAMGAGSQRR